MTEPEELTCPLDGFALPAGSGTAAGDELSAHMIRAHNLELDEAIRIREAGLKDLAAKVEERARAAGATPKRLDQPDRPRDTGGYL